MEGWGEEEEEGRTDGIKRSTASRAVWTAPPLYGCGSRCVLGGKRQRVDRRKKPERGCLPGCCSLGPLTGASALFSNTAHRHPDKTKTLIYTSLYLAISLCFSWLCDPPPPSLISACVWLFFFLLCFVSLSVHVYIYLIMFGCLCLCFHFSSGCRGAGW